MLLRKANVVEGALALLEAEGLDGLTMRKLGAALNVQAGALYRHFPSKEALLDAMAEKLVEGIADPAPEGAGRSMMLQRLRIGRRCPRLDEHRHGGQTVRIHGLQRRLPLPLFLFVSFCVFCGYCCVL